MALFSIVVFYIPFFLFLYSLAQNLLHKLQNLPPGPFLIFPVIGHIHLLKKPPHKNLHRLSKKYGPVFLLQLGSCRALVVNSASAAAECLTGANDAVFANRPRLLAGKHLGYNYMSVSWAPYGDHWRNLRRISSIELLSSKRTQSLSQIRLDEIRILIRYLFEASMQNPGTVVDMKALTFEMLFNVMTKMILGKRFYGKNQVDSVEAKEFQGIIAQMHKVVGKSTLDDFVPILRWIMKTEDGYQATHRRRDKFFQDLIEGIRGRLGSGTDQKLTKTLIQALLSLRESDPEYYTDELIKSLTAVLLQGGSDTSAATLEWSMALLVNNPDILERAQAEIDRHIGHEHRLINEFDLSNLSYLQCIVNETLRLYPPVPLLLPHQASDDCTVKGYRVPRGTMLLVNAWAVNRDPKIWDDPDMFKPDRFLKSGGMEECGYLPFGAGRRGCPGEALARRTIATALGSLLQCFDWERESSTLEDMSEDSGAVATKTRPLMVKCRPRSGVVNLLSQI